MTLELSQVYTLHKNKYSVADVGPLAPEGVAYLKAKTDIVRVIGSSVNHFFEKDRAISYFEIITMSYGLRHGLMIGDASKPNCLIINYISPNSSVRFKIAIKSANNFTELWISTMHRLRPRQTMALLKRGVIVRTHD